MSARRVPYTDEGIPMMREVMQTTWDALPEDTKREMQERALAMTPEQWDEFASAVVLDGPSLAELRANAIERAS